MSQREWAKYFLEKGSTNENVNIGWSPGAAQGRSTPKMAKKHLENLETPPSSPKEYGNIVAASYKMAGKRKNRKTRRNRRASRRSRR
jgi:hypothetical protein